MHLSLHLPGMKNLLLISCLLYTGTSSAQWMQLSIPTTKKIVSSSFITDNEGWVGTENAGQAFIHHTSNGGITWNTLTVTGGTNGASYVCFVSPDTGYVVVNTIAVKTTDGGITWDPLVLPGIPYYAPFFVNADTGFINGDEEIFKTTDGGQTWTSYPTVSYNPFYRMDFLNGTFGAGCGFDDYPYATSDGGLTWDIVDDGGLWSYFYAVAYKPDGHFYYTGYEDIFGDVTYFIRGQNDFSSQDIDNLYALHWFDNNKGYAAGGSGYVVLTEDGGINWEVLVLPDLFGVPAYDLLTISGINDVYIFGENGSGFKFPANPQCTLLPQYSYIPNEYTFQFTDQTPGATEWLWYFGDGDSSIVQNPIHTFSSDGIYEVCLFASNDTCEAGYAGCKDVFVCSSNLSVSVAGSIDTTFSDDGVVSNFFDGYYPECHSVVVQSDHKVLGLDFGSGSELARYLSTGVPDSTFDGDGIFEQDEDFSGQVVKLNSSGKVLIAGEAGDKPLYITCLNEDGTYNSAFGIGGIVQINPGGGPDYENLFDMEVQPDDKIVLLSHYTYGSSEFTQLIRFNPDGSADNNFSGNGIATLNSYVFRFYNAEVGALSIQPDGKYVIAGQTDLPQTQIAIARITADGTTDSTFDADGIAEFDLTTEPYKDYAVDIVCQPDGKLVVAANTFQQMVILRLNPNGMLDPSFGTNGMVMIDAFDNYSIAVGIDLQPDGKIILLGSVDFSPPNKVLLMRLNADGSFDSSFGNNGSVLTSVDCEDLRPFDVVLHESDIYVGTSSEAVGWCIVNYNNVACVPVVAEYTFTATDLTVQFTDQTVGSTTWQWDFGDGTTSSDQNPVHVYSQTGSYDVCLISSNDCSADTICSTVTIIATGDQQAGNTFFYSIFPNPFSENTFIQFSLQNNQFVKIELYNVQGKKMKTIQEGNLEVGNHRVTLNSDGLVPSVYMLELKTDLGWSIHRLIVQ